MTALPPMDLRPMRESDRHLVLSSWLRSYAGRSLDARDYTGEARGAFSVDYVPVIRALLGRSRVIVACLTDEPDAIVGWMAWEADTLHYVLVKPRWRQLGIARWMLADFAEMPVVFTHRTGDALRCPVPKGWVYRRWLIWPREEAA